MASWLVLLLLVPAISATPPRRDINSPIIREKPGKCIGRVFIAIPCFPNQHVRLCRNDRDCPGTKKCCRTERCLTQCEEPAAPKPGVCPDPSQVTSGALDRCDVDTDCGENNKKCCKNANGFKRCVKPKSKEKPGQCIRRAFIRVACQPHEIVKLCSSDGDCPGTKKCCQTDRCVTSCEEPAVKPGKCIVRAFIALLCQPHEIVKLCSSDGDCPGTKKCCQTERCVTSCEEPAGPKPGECPHPSRVGTGSSNCDQDTDCGVLNSKKCCENAAGSKRCSKPRGKCPDTSGIITTCQFTERNCLSDSQCLSDKLCCPYGCGKECLKPVS